MLKAEDNLIEVPLMVHLSDIHSVTDFQRNTKDHLKRLEKSRRPLVLTLNGKAKAVVIDAQSYDELMEKVEQAKTVEAVGEGLEDVKRGRTKPAAEVLERMRRKHKLPREA